MKLEPDNKDETEFWSFYMTDNASIEERAWEGNLRREAVYVQNI